MMNESFDLDAVLDAVTRGNSAAFMQVVQAYGLVVRSYLVTQLYNASERCSSALSSGCNHSEPTLSPGK